MTTAKKLLTCDHTYTREVVCPHCGHEHSGSWEMSEGKHECVECGKVFELTHHTDVTYSTEKHVPHEVRLKQESAKLKPPDLSFRDGAPPVASRVGKLHIYDTQFSVWDDSVDAGMLAVLCHVLAVLHQRGIGLVRDPEIEERYPSLANEHWSGRRGELQLKVRLGGRHVEVKAYQGPSEYGHFNLGKLPRAMQLGVMSLFSTLVRELGRHGYAVGEPREAGRPIPLVVRDAMLGHQRSERRTPLEAFDDQWKANRHERDETGFMAEKEWRLACWGGGKDGDGVLLHTGDTRYFYHYSTNRLMRGTFYPAPNGQCMVAAGGEYLWMQQSKLFDCDPTKTRRRYVPGQRERLHREIEKALKEKKYDRVATLGAVLARSP